jgi:hypothetical protein
MGKKLLIVKKRIEDGKRKMWRRTNEKRSDKKGGGVGGDGMSWMEWCCVLCAMMEVIRLVWPRSVVYEEDEEHQMIWFGDSPRGAGYGLVEPGGTQD